jgi:alpha-1,2-glucosyltransferase
LTSGGYIIVWFLFVAFLVVNEGIVVGDRTAHQVNFHPTQILYFCAFTLALTAPYQVTKLSRFLGFVRKNLLLSAVCLAGMALTVHYFTLAHPYLLADNRHYTFYIWRRLINFRPFVKYLLVPVYFFGGYCVLHSIRRTSVIFQLTFPLCVAVNLAPQLLLEFRYFVVPFLFYRMQVRPVSWPKLVLETAVYAAVNAAAIAIYVMRPFRWEHEPDDVQRFMW